MYSHIFAAAALVASARASSNYLGFNSGATNADGSAKLKADYVNEFTNAAALEGAPGVFNSIRLYTNIQAGTTADPIQAFDAAIDTNTTLLLGIWASGTASIENELTALSTALTNLGDDLTKLVVGISIGSEDLYRDSVMGITNEAGIGAGPDTIVGFINDYKTKFANTALASVPVGHVDTWDAFTNGSNSAVIEASDWLGVDEYPYYESGQGNSIENSARLFKRAYDAVVGVAGGKPVWVTETGYPYEGITWDQAVPSLENAKTFWDEVGCEMLFNKVPTYWYNFVEDNGANKQKFAITHDESTTPRFNLTCPTTTESDSSDDSDSSTPTTTAGSSTATGSHSNGTATGSGPSTTATGTGSGSGSGSDGTSTDSDPSSATSAVSTGGAAKLGSSALAALAAVVAAFALL